MVGITSNAMQVWLQSKLDATNDSINATKWGQTWYDFMLWAARGGISATAGYILVDVNPAAGTWPHSATTKVFAGKIRVHFESTGGVWQISVGIIKSITATEATLEWIDSFVVATALRGDVVIDNPLSHAGIQESDIASGNDTATAFQTDATNYTSLGAAIAPAAGDLVLLATLVSGAGTLYLTASGSYRTE